MYNHEHFSFLSMSDKYAVTENTNKHLIILFWDCFMYDRDNTLHSLRNDHASAVVKYILKISRQTLLYLGLNKLAVHVIDLLGS